MVFNLFSNIQIETIVRYICKFVTNIIILAEIHQQLNIRSDHVLCSLSARIRY